MSDIEAEKNFDYDNWFQTKVQNSLEGLENGSIGLLENSDIIAKTEKLFS